jgi:hypothetical protein
VNVFHVDVLLGLQLLNPSRGTLYQPSLVTANIGNNPTFSFIFAPLGVVKSSWLPSIYPIPPTLILSSRSETITINDHPDSTGASERVSIKQSPNLELALIRKKAATKRRLV